MDLMNAKRKGQLAARLPPPPIHNHPMPQTHTQNDVHKEHIMYQERPNVSEALESASHEAPFSYASYSQHEQSNISRLKTHMQGGAYNPNQVQVQPHDSFLTPVYGKYVFLFQRFLIVKMMAVATSPNRTRVASVEFLLAQLPPLLITTVLPL